MAAARLKVGTGTQSRAVPDRLEASVFQVLHSPQALPELTRPVEEDGTQKTNSFYSFSIKITTASPSPYIPPRQYFFVQALLRYQVTGNFLFSNIFCLLPPWR
jgi:hypothetical protein